MHFVKLSLSLLKQMCNKEEDSKYLFIIVESHNGKNQPNEEEPPRRGQAGEIVQFKRK